MSYTQKNLEHLFQRIGSFQNQAFVRTKHFDYIRTVDSAWPNQLLNLKASKQELDSILDKIEHDASSGAIPAILMGNPHTENSVLRAIVKQRNYRSSVWYAMSHSLKDLPALPTRSDFKTIQVQTNSELDSWLSIVKDELMGGVSLNKSVFAQLLQLEPCTFFLGIENNLPVASSLLFKEQQLAGIYLVATKKTHRKKGYARYMTLQCLLKAQEMGSKRAELQATELGKRVYENLGFSHEGAIHVHRIEKANQLDALPIL